MFSLQDLHWALYTSHCSPCLANFTYIIHLENKQEAELVLNMTGLGGVVGGNHLRNPTPGGESRAVLERYLGELSCEQLHRLDRRYRPDLTLFQY